MRLSVLLTCVLVSGCGGATKLPDLSPGVACPEPKPYSKKVQKRAAAELRKFGGRVPTLREFIKDYKVLRDQARACR